MASQYTFTPYSPQWPIQFEEEAQRLYRVLAGEVLVIHHIGSTAVPGLAAKPIIDMLPVVRDIETVDGLRTGLERSGYRAWGAEGLPGRRYFTKDQEGIRIYNLHIYQDANPEVERHLALCAYLRAHGSAREAYAALKREVYARHPADIGAYNKGKDEWLKRLEPVAVAWYREQAGRL